MTIYRLNSAWFWELLMITSKNNINNCYRHTFMAQKMCAYDVIVSVMYICVISTFARGPWVVCKIMLLPEHGNVLCRVADLLLSCNFYPLANWRVKKYKFLMTTLNNTMKYMMDFYIFLGS